MKVLSIGSDRSLFADSEALGRVREYSSKVEFYHVIVFSKRNLGLIKKNEANLYLYPTNSHTKLFYIFDALILSWKILSKESNLNNWVVTVQDPFESGMVGWLIKLFFTIPLQVQVHTDFLSTEFGGFLNSIRLLISGIVIKRSDGIRVVSSVIRDSVVKKYPLLEKKIEILPIFVDIKSILNFVPKKNIKEEFPNFNFIILMASRLTPEKRIDLAISALQKITNIYPKTGLVICGSGPEKNKLVDLTDQLKVEQSVVFKDWQYDLISYFKTADMYLLTSEFEGYGMTLIEAAAAGIPIVSTSVGMAKTNMFKNGYNISICKDMTYSCVADEVMAVISNAELRKKYIENARTAVSSVAISRTEYVGRYIGLLEKLFNK
ncbi:MAG: glycosyltransferase [Minisyncoccia bacterium]